MIVKNVVKNDNGKLDVVILFTNLEIDILNGVEYRVDKDDPEQTSVVQGLKDGILQARNKTRPAK